MEMVAKGFDEVDIRYCGKREKWFAIIVKRYTKYSLCRPSLNLVCRIAHFHMSRPYIRRNFQGKLKPLFPRRFNGSQDGRNSSHSPIHPGLAVQVQTRAPAGRRTIARRSRPQITNGNSTMDAGGREYGRTTMQPQPTSSKNGENTPVVGRKRKF